MKQPCYAGPQRHFTPALIPPELIPPLTIFAVPPFLGPWHAFHIPECIATLQWVLVARRSASMDLNSVENETSRKILKIFRNLTLELDYFYQETVQLY